MSIRVIEKTSDLEKERELWACWPATPDTDLDYFLFIVRSRPEVLKPYVLLAFHEGIPEAMLAGRMEQRKIPIRFGYLDLRSPPIRVLCILDGGLRGNARPENITLLVGHILESLRRGDIDLAIFEHLRVDSPLYHGIRTLSRGLERGISRGRSIHRILQLPDHSEELYKILPAEQRQNYRRKGRKLVKDFTGDVKIKCYTSTSELDLVFQEVETIAQKTYQRGLGFGFDDTPEMRGRMALAASKGWLRVYILYIAGRPAAFWNAMAYSGTLYGNHIGYDPEFRHYSPGMFLSLTKLAEFCENKRELGITQVDYGLGDAEYKSLLSNQSYQEEDVWIYGRTVRGIGINAISSPVLLADRTAKNFLAKHKLLARTKRFWRSQAARAQKRPGGQ